MKTSLIALFACVCVSIAGWAETPQDSNVFIPIPGDQVFLLSTGTGFAVPIASYEMGIVSIHSAVRTTGTQLMFQSYRTEYLNSSISVRQRISENIGIQGVRQYAAKVGYTPMYQGRPGQGQGFDLVYKMGRRIVVIEAKGGTGQLMVYRGHLQGTPAYTVAVAKATLRSSTASQQAKRAAQEVIKAYKTGRLDIEVVTTDQVYGKPKTTHVKTLYGKSPSLSSRRVLINTGLYAGGIAALLGGGLDVIAQLSSGEEVDWKRVRDMTMLSGASGYVGTITGALVQQALMRNSSQLAAKLAVSRLGSMLSGGFVGAFTTGAIFSYGSYFLGYSDLRTANRNVLAATTGSALGAFGGAAAFGTVAAFGTASTGTAISTLYGAAATKATLAWFGGGAVAAGGGGTAVGATVLSGGIALIAIAAGAGVMYLFHLDDEQAERGRVEHLIKHIKEHVDQQIESPGTS